MFFTYLRNQIIRKGKKNLIMNLLLRLSFIAILPLFLQKEQVFTPVEPVEEIARYCNSRFDFCVEYPASTLSNKLISDNGDGIFLATSNDELNVFVSGSWSVSNKDTWGLYDDFIAEKLERSSEGQVRYCIVRNNYYEVVYFLNDKCYYQKLIDRGGKHIVIQIEVSRAQYWQIQELRNKIELDW